MHPEEHTHEAAQEKAKQACKKLGQLATQAGVTQEAIANATGYQRSNINRLFSGRYTPRLDIVIAVLTAISDLSGKPYSLKDIDYEQDQTKQTGAWKGL